MKSAKLLLIGVLFFALTAPALAQDGRQNGDHGQPNAGAPELVIDEMTHDFGEVKAGTPLRWSFKIKNTGKADLLINSVSPG